MEPQKEVTLLDSWNNTMYSVYTVMFAAFAYNAFVVQKAWQFGVLCSIIAAVNLVIIAYRAIKAFKAKYTLPNDQVLLNLTVGGVCLAGLLIVLFSHTDAPTKLSWGIGLSFFVVFHGMGAFAAYERSKRPQKEEEKPLEQERR